MTSFDFNLIGPDDPAGCVLRRAWQLLVRDRRLVLPPPDDSLEALTAQGSLESVFLKLTTEDVQ